jgi:hypothetical protein
MRMQNVVLVLICLVSNIKKEVCGFEFFFFFLFLRKYGEEKTHFHWRSEYHYKRCFKGVKGGPKTWWRQGEFWYLILALCTSFHTLLTYSPKRKSSRYDIVPNDYVNLNISCSLLLSLSLSPPPPLTLTLTLHQHILNFLPSFIRYKGIW